MSTDAMTVVENEPIDPELVVVSSRATLESLDSPEACYAYVRTQCYKLEMVNSLGYWQVGEVTNRLDEKFEVENPIQAMSRETGASDRMIRYCDVTFRAFEKDDLRVLCRKGMQWSTVRELASDIVTPYRDRLVDLFLADTLTDLEVRNFVAKIKGGTPLSALIDDAGARIKDDDDEGSTSSGKSGSELNKQFEKLKTSLVKHTKAFVEDSKSMNTGLCGELSDVLFRPDGTDDPEIVDELADVENELQKLIVEAVDLVKVVHLLSIRSDYPFLNLETMLNSIKIKFALGQNPEPLKEQDPALNLGGDDDNTENAGEDGGENEDGNIEV